MEVHAIKTIAVFAVIFGCFAVLYPKIFHPILMQLFGFYPETGQDDYGKHLPPHLRKPGMQGSVRQTPQGDDVMRHMKHGGPHPGMRAAAEMQKQQGAQGGGRGGMMGVVLPMYAIGIIIYLIYTLSKVFGGKKKEQEADERYVKARERGALSNVRYSADRRKFMYGEEDSDGEDDEQYNMRQNTRKQRDLERLLFKADKDKISNLEMRELKRRLLETEAQMTRILSAMETVQDRVVDHVQQGEPEGEYMEDDSGEYDMHDQLSSQAPSSKSHHTENVRQRRPQNKHAPGDDDQYDTYEERNGDFDEHGQYDDRFQDGDEIQDGDEFQDGDIYEDEGDFQDGDQEEDIDEERNEQKDYEEDFENSESEIEEQIEIEEVEDSEDEDFVPESREEGDGESGEFYGEFQGNETESDENESEGSGPSEEFKPSPTESHPDLRKRTVKGDDPRNNED